MSALWCIVIRSLWTYYLFNFTVWLIILSSIIADVEESEEEIESESLIFMLFTCVGDLFSNREIHHSRSVALQT